MKNSNQSAQTTQTKVKKVRPNPRWTKETAKQYISTHSVQGLTYLSAKDFLSKHGGSSND